MDSNITLTNQCIQTVNNLGSTSYYNICTGKISTVPWGQGDFMVMIIVAGCFITLILGAFIMITHDIRKY